MTQSSITFTHLALGTRRISEAKDVMLISQTISVCSRQSVFFLLNVKLIHFILIKTENTQNYSLTLEIK